MAWYDICINTVLSHDNLQTIMEYLENPKEMGINWGSSYVFSIDWFYCENSWWLEK